MFSSKDKLKKRTPKGGIGREDYINLLAGEFYETSSADAKEQITANLANFAYDPINFDYLRTNNVLEIFLHTLVSGSDRLVLHGIAGICNLCLDPEIKKNIFEADAIVLISNLLNNINPEIILNALTTLIFLIDEENKNKIINPDNINTILELSSSDNPRIKNLAKLFLEDHCKKSQIELATKRLRSKNDVTATTKTK